MAMSAAVREVAEEAGLQTEVIRLRLCRRNAHPGLARECKLWFHCKDLGGTPSAAAIEATREGIVSAYFLLKIGSQE